MKYIDPVEITDDTLTSSNVDDAVYMPHVHATGTITTPAAGMKYATGIITCTPNNHTHASGTITVSVLNPGIWEQFVVGAQTFKFVVSGSDPGDVVKSNDPNTLAANIVTSINRDIPDTVSASANNNIVTVTALTVDAATGNDIPFYEPMPIKCIAMSGSGTLAGGIDQLPVIGESFVIGSQTFTFVVSGTATGNVVCSGAANQLGINIATSVNRDIPETVSANNNSGIVTITAVAEGAAGNAVDFTEAASGISINGSGHLFGGADNAVALGETFVVGGQTFTIVASGTATGNVVRSTESATAQGHNIETAINRDIPDIVTAVHTLGVVNLTAVAELAANGNAVKLTSAVTGVTVSGSGTLSGGTDLVNGKLEWNAETDFAIGAEVVITATHKLYESLRTPNINKPPATNLTGETPYWKFKGYTNRWKMLKGIAGAQTSNPDEIVVVLTPGVTIDSIALLNVNCQHVHIVMESGGVTRYSKTVTPASTASTKITETDLPDYPAATLTVTITNTGDNARCGLCNIGNIVVLGTILRKPQIGLVDHSIKSAIVSGNYSITRRSFSKTIECGFSFQAAELSTIKRLIAQNRATLLVWIVDVTYSITILYGFIKRCKIKVYNDTVSQCEITIEGFI